MRIGVDTGGTFTDFVVFRGDEVEVAKVPSTPKDPARAILAGCRQFEPFERGAALVHGSTVATNALLERKLARVTWVTNRNLEDVLEIGRQARPDLFALDIEKPVPLVPRARRLGVDERTDRDGKVIEPLTRGKLAELRERVGATRPEAIAVGLLFSFLNDESEKKIAAALEPLGVPISMSTAVAPEVREFERYSTTVANAALVPVVSRYLENLEANLPGVRLFVFQSNGGMARADTVSRLPVRLVLSGPAGGAVAAARVATNAGLDSALTLDMGGTSTDVSLSMGKPLRRGEVEIAGLPLLVPSLDIQTVGAGGGSIAWVDQAGILRVGPRSAGSDPGPACYGRSELPTVTDAHAVLGRLPVTLAGGAVELDSDRSHRALEALGKRLRLKRHAAAEGVLAVADATMARAARVVSLGRGTDPRHLPLFAFGGAGPLHAARLTQALPCRSALVPPLPGNLSAYGMALADAERDLVRSILVRDPDRQRRRIDRELGRLVEDGAAELRRDGFLRRGGTRPAVEQILECRYVGQSYTLPVVPGESIRGAFDRAHEARFGHAFPEREVEAVNARVRLVLAAAPPAAPASRTGRRGRPPAAAHLGDQQGWFDGQSRSTPRFARAALRPGNRIEGPAIVEELGATTVIEPGFEATVDPAGNLLLRPPD